MALSVTSNFAISAGYASNNMKNSQTLMGKSINRISSGLRAPKPGDDAVSFVGGTKLKADSSGYSVLSTGIQNLAAKHNMADAVLSDVGNALLDLRAKAIEYTAATGDGDAQELIQKDAAKTITALNNMINATSTKYKGTALFNGTADNAYFTLDGTNMALNAISSYALTVTSATMSLTKIDADIKKINQNRADIGSNLSALQQISNYLSDLSSSADAAYTAVTEVDYAREMTAYVKNNVQSQAAQAMVSQANQSLAQVLNLLQV